MTQLSQHFDSEEFTCRCCGKLPDGGMNHELLVLLETIRAELGGYPVVVNSGYRCLRHNTNVGGATHSQHLSGNAADIVVSRRSPNEVYICADKLNPKGGVGSYNTFTHVDVRGHKARW